MKVAIVTMAMAMVAAVGAAYSASAQTPTATMEPQTTTEPVPLSDQTHTPIPATPSVPSATEAAQTPPFSLSAKLVEDKDGDGTLSAGDSAPQTTLVTLASWARWNNGIQAGATEIGQASVAGSADAVVSLLTENDGSFAFTNIPPGDYTLIVWWMGGFVRGGARTVPYAFQVVISIRNDGTVGTPAAFPPNWPGIGDLTSPATEVAQMGALPSVILLKPLPAGMVPYPVSTGANQPTGVGSVDVGAVIARLSLPAPRLPVTGDGASRGFGAGWWLVGAVLGLSLGIAGIAVRRR